MSSEDDEPSAYEQLVAEFGTTAVGTASERFTGLQYGADFIKAWAILDDAAATRKGLQAAYDDPDTKETIEKQAVKAEFEDTEAGVAAYIDMKASKAEEASRNKALVIMSFLENHGYSRDDHDH